MKNDFKVGDWVRNIPLNKLYKVTELTEYSITITKWQFNLTDTASLNSFELWKPKPLEWCWFSNGNEPYLRQYSHGIDNGFYFDINNVPFRFCEPYIGELPTFIKEQHDTNDNPSRTTSQRRK